MPLPSRTASATWSASDGCAFRLAVDDDRRRLEARARAGLGPARSPTLKNELQINVELASPGDFIPLPEGWEERSPLAERRSRLAFRHFDPYSQALAKLERDPPATAPTCAL